MKGKRRFVTQTEHPFDDRKCRLNVQARYVIAADTFAQKIPV